MMPHHLASSYRLVGLCLSWQPRDASNHANDRMIMRISNAVFGYEGASFLLLL
jgi:hypothetical protein